MRRLVPAAVFAVAIALIVPALNGVAGQGMNQDRVVPGGGITAPGWVGKIIDRSSIQQGRVITDSKFAAEGAGLRLIIGPAAIYWNPANTASGDYTVSAKFHEPKYQDANDHPHPYGLFIGGNKLDTDQRSLAYCTPYGNGTFIFRGFAPAAPPSPQGTWQMGGRAPMANAAVHKAAGIGEPVTQDIAMSVKGDQVSCSINGTVVATYPKSELVVPGKLESTDGIYGIRVSHNLEVVVTGLKKS